MRDLSGSSQLSESILRLMSKLHPNFSFKGGTIKNKKDKKMAAKLNIVYPQMTTLVMGLWLKLIAISQLKEISVIMTQTIPGGYIIK